MEETEIIESEQKKKSRAIKLLKRIVLVLAIIFFLVSATAFVAVYYYGDEIEDAFVDEVNKQLNITFDVKDISISIIRHFPYASMEFSGVISGEKIAYGDQPRLLNAESISILFNLNTLFGSDIRIKKVEIRDAEINLITLWNGNINYDILVPGSSASDSSFIYQLGEILLINTSIGFRDLNKDRIVFFTADPLSLKGLLSAEKIILDIEGVMKECNYSEGGKKYIVDEDLETKIPLIFYNDEALLEFGESTILLDGQEIIFHGRANTGSDPDTTMIAFECNGTDIESIIKYLPEPAGNFLRGINAKGRLSFKSKYVSVPGKKRSENFNVSFELNRGSYLFRKINLEFEDSDIVGSLAYSSKGGKKETTIKLDRISAMLGHDIVKAKILYNDKNLQTLEILLTATLGFKELKKTLEPHDITPAGGEMDIDLKFIVSKKTLSDISYSDFKNNALSGSIEFNDIAAKAGEFDIKDFTGIIDLEGNTAEGEIAGEVNGDKFHFKGVMYNIIPSLLEKSENFEAEGKLIAEKIDLEKYKSDKKGGGYSFSSAPRLDLEISIQEFINEKFLAENIHGHIALGNNSLIFESLEFSSMKGDVRLDGGIQQDGNEAFKGDCKATIKAVDIKELFRQMDNFGQKSLTYKHLDGILYGDADISLVFDSVWKIQLPDIVVSSRISIESGEIIGYQPLIELTKFIKAGDLSHVLIDPVENEIMIRDMLITIPEMEVRTNAIDLTFSGKHHFSNEIDYHFRVLLSELLGKKARSSKKENAEFGYVEEDGIGQTTLFLHLTGTMDSPDFKYDRKEVSNKIKEDFREEKKEMGSILKQEFKWIAGDSLKKEERKKERKKIKKQEEGKFILDWDEE